MSTNEPASALLTATERASLVGNYFTTAVMLSACSGTAILLAKLIRLWKYEFIDWNPHIVWMPYAAETIFFLLLLLLCAPLAWLMKATTFERVVAFPFGFLLGLTAFSGFGWFNLWAVLLLSLGLAVQSVRLITNHRERVFKASRYVAAIAIPFMILYPTILLGWRAYDESSQRAALPAAKADAPNVLLIVWDTVRADSVGTIHSEGAATPNLDRLAEQGITYERAISPASWTLPAHASMFTGRFPNELSVDWFTALTENHKTVAEAMREQGYDTAGFVANTRYCGRAIGMNQGFTHYEDYKCNVRWLGSFNFWYRAVAHSFPSMSRQKNAPEISSDFLAWHDSREGRPFFAFLNYLDAHTPYLPEKLLPSGRQLTADERAAMNQWDQRDPDTITESEIRFAKRCYESQITFLDDQLGRLLDDLDERGQLDNTVVIVVSDHGEQFGEHGAYYHGNSLYRSAVHVPLVVVPAKRLAEGIRVKQPVSTRNMAATILDVAGIARDRSLTGESLIEIATAERNDALESDRDQIVYAHNSLEQRKQCGGILPVFVKSIGWQGPMELWVTGDYFLLQRPDGDSELYNMTTDPLEQNNLAGDVDFEATQQLMQWQLNDYLDWGRSTHVVEIHDEQGGRATAVIEGEPDSF